MGGRAVRGGDAAQRGSGTRPSDGFVCVCVCMLPPTCVLHRLAHHVAILILHHNHLRMGARGGGEGGGREGTRTPPKHRTHTDPPPTRARTSSGLAMREIMSARSWLSVLAYKALRPPGGPPPPRPPAAGVPGAAGAPANENCKCVSVGGGELASERAIDMCAHVQGPPRRTPHPQPPPHPTPPTHTPARCLGPQRCKLWSRRLGRKSSNSPGRF